MESQEPYHRTIEASGRDGFDKRDLNDLDTGQVGLLSGQIDRAVNGFRLRVRFVRRGMIVVCKLFVA